MAAASYVNPDFTDTGMGFAPDSMHAFTGPSTQGLICRTCGGDGHFSRDCPDRGENHGKCFNCGEDGHNKAECPNQRVFSGTCRHCNQEGHMGKDCPDKPTELCKNCGQEGHKIAQCTEPRALDFSGVPDQTPDEAWATLTAADRQRDLDDVREAVMMYVKALPRTTYLELEGAFRSNLMNTHIIASEKEITDTFTLMDLQGNLDRKYTVGFFLSDKPQRNKMLAGWPESAEQNLERLAHAGIPVDRKIPKCMNCEKLGHMSMSCPEPPRERSDRVEIKCVNCDQPGHRVRDCPEPRKDRFACRNCGQSGHKASECTEPRSADNVECRHCNEKGHFAKDCPTKPLETCRNCGEEGHRSKECTNAPNPAMMQCRNCDEMGHKSRECPKPTDWSRVQCQNCSEYGHTKVRCKAPPNGDGNGNGEAATNGFANHGGFGSANGGADSYGAGDAGWGGGYGGGYGGSADPAVAATDSGEW